MNNDEIQSFSNDIAIVGMAGRFPGAKDVNDFWQNLHDGVESISAFSDEELLEAGLAPAMLNDPNYVKVGAMLDDVELFDASFFGFTPSEAEIMDPQHRLFLECAWNAIESSGYDPEAYPGWLGVYAGTNLSTYMLRNLMSNPNSFRANDMQIGLGNDKDYLATRVSYKLNLKGPSINVNTACSTSLVAVHLACRGLLSYQCDMALAGGVSVTVPQKEGYYYEEGGIASPDGHCRAFDVNAQGTIFGSGIGIVVLKRLQEAIKDGDYIHAVIKGSAINNDGSLKVGYTAPSVAGQIAVIAEAQAIANIEPSTLTYIEAHGTATPLGDPIEIKALKKAFGAQAQKGNFCALGSVKTNVGHLNTAAGVTGLIKTALALEHKQIPPSLHFEEANPELDLANSPFYVNTSLSEWHANGTPRRAGINSFGMGGTNAHVILEEAPTLQSTESARPWQLLVLSAKTDTALESAASNLADHLKQNGDASLADVAYTLHVGRRAFNHRQIVVCQDAEDAVDALEQRDPRRVFTSALAKQARSIRFMFPGQGAQYVNMAGDLYRTEPTFREQIDHCAERLRKELALELRDVLYPDPDKVGEASSLLQETRMAQVALFVIEYALAQLWLSWGVQPQAMIGHSIGEYVAACLAGVFTLEEALSLVTERGRLMQQMPGGAMLSVNLSAEDMQSFLNRELSLAAANGPSLSVVAGSYESIESLQSQLVEQNIECRRLHTSHAFHSEMMEPILEQFMECVGRVELNEPTIPYLSNVTGDWIKAEEATDPEYWARHLRQTVRFAEGIEKLLDDPDAILLEVGPGRTLSTLARQQPQLNGQIVLDSLPGPKEQGADLPFVYQRLGRLWLAGVEIDWTQFYAHEGRRRRPLPTYPFERQRYWVDQQSQGPELFSRPQTLSKKADLADWFYLPSWKQVAPPSLLKQEIQAEQDVCWLFFMNQPATDQPDNVLSIGAKLVDRLIKQGEDVIIVETGAEFTRFNESRYALAPGQPDDYSTLLNELSAMGKRPTKVVHLWNVIDEQQADKADKSNLYWLNEAQNISFYSLLFLAQVLGKQALSDEFQISVLSNHMQDVAGEGMSAPEKSLILGPVHVIPQEYLNMSCRSIDIVLPNADSWQEEQLVTNLVAELSTKPSDSVIAYRGHHRYVKTFESVRLEEPTSRTPRLKENGVYLITGGLGGIGLLFAEHLAKTIGPKLILTGRSALPSRDKWDEWLATYDDPAIAATQDSTTSDSRASNNSALSDTGLSDTALKVSQNISHKIRKVKELEALGAEVLVFSADVANLEQMETVVQQAEEQFGPVNGVIHAAGLVDGGSVIQDKTREDAELVLAPKVQGTLALDMIFQNSQLDFWLFCSSISALHGVFGLADYAAANAFLDAFANHRATQNGDFTVSINWDAWQEVGMAVNAAPVESLSEHQLEILRQGILPQEGLEAFGRILSNSLPQVLVSTRDFGSMLAQSKAFREQALAETLDKSSGAKPIHARPELGNAYVAPRNETEQSVVDIWQDLLGIEQIGIYDNFFELGGHSLLATQLVSRMREAFRLELPLGSLFEEPTVVGSIERIEMIRQTMQQLQASPSTMLDDREEIAL